MSRVRSVSPQVVGVARPFSQGVRAMSKSIIGSAVSIEVSVDEGRALIRCGRCGVEQVLWTRVDLGLDGIAALFTEEHLQCSPAVTTGEAAE